MQTPQYIEPQEGLFPLTIECPVYRMERLCEILDNTEHHVAGLIVLKCLQKLAEDTFQVSFE